MPATPHSCVRPPGALRRFAAAGGLGALAIALTCSGIAPGAGAATTTSAVPKLTTTTRGGTTTAAPRTTAAATTTTTTPAASARHSAPSSATTTTTTPSGAPATTDPAGVTLVSQPAWIPTAGIEVLQLRLDQPKLASDPSAEVHIAVHEPVRSRSDFNDAVTGKALGNTIAGLQFPLSTLQVNRYDNFLVGFGLAGSGAPKSIGIQRAGVYPVEVGLVDASPTHHGTFTTWMVVVDPSNTGSEPLRLSWIWRLETPPLTQPSGAIDPHGLAELQPGGRLDRIATLLARAGALPLTLGIGP